MIDILILHCTHSSVCRLVLSWTCAFNFALLSLSSQMAAKKPFGKQQHEHAMLEVDEWRALAEALPELRKTADEINTKMNDEKTGDAVTFPCSVTKILSTCYMARLNLYQVIAGRDLQIDRLINRLADKRSFIVFNCFSLSSFLLSLRFHQARQHTSPSRLEPM